MNVVLLRDPFLGSGLLLDFVTTKTKDELYEFGNIRVDAQLRFRSEYDLFL